MKKAFAVFGMVLLAALLVMPGPAKSEMYIEGYIGGVAAPSDSFSFGTEHPTWPGTETHSIPGRFDNPFFLGGMKLGIWFDKTGITGGYNWPDWAKYFGFYLDLCYHNLDYKRQNGSTVAIDFLPDPPLSLTTGNEFWSRGRVFTLGFMFAARYGFLPDSEVPFGRLQPYIAVGPALMVSSQRVEFNSRLSNFGFPGPTFNLTSNTKSSTDIALAVEAGLRYMALKNVSIDVSFKYRWAEPSYSFSVYDDFNDSTTGYKFSPSYHLLSGQVGAAYHF
jgi:opacity protein-like surface antigen